MKNPMIVTGENEKVIKKIDSKKTYILITEKRVILETNDASFSVLLSSIGSVGMIKDGSSYAIRLYSKDGNNIFAYEKNYSFGSIRRDEATVFENVLNTQLCKESESAQDVE